MEGFLGGGVVDLKTTQSWAHFPNASFDIVALAASAGGLTALSHILAALPAGFPAVLAVVQHLDPRHRSLFLESVLASLHAGAIAIDRNFTILMWNHQAGVLWGRRAEEVRGQCLLSGDPPHGGMGVRIERLAVPR
jgi:hypothetical protein